MKNRKSFQYVPGIVLAGSVAVMAVASGCSAVNQIEGAAQGCSQFPGSISSLSITGEAQAFVTAAADVVNEGQMLETSVLTACTGIDGDLMVTDTWTAMGPDGGSGGTLDAEVTEACTQAANAITAALSGDAGASADCGLSITGGGCQAMASVEASCEASCSGMASCTPPSVMASCSPGSLSGQCSGMCMANATCEGSATVQANCTGTCEADCTGMCTPPSGGSLECSGTCMGTCSGTCAGGTMTGGMCSGTCQGQCMGGCMLTAASPGHCSGTCSGTCNGNCQVNEMGGISCGAMATCKGGCSVAVTAPTCEGSVQPAMCSSNVNCQGSCQSHANLEATCTPPTVTLQCDASASASVQAVVTTVQKNLPILVQAVQTQGPIFVAAAKNLVSIGGSVASDITSQTGQAIACAAVAAKASVTASASVSVSVQASASVTTSAGASM
jgi:hypothetical protein